MVFPRIIGGGLKFPQTLVTDLGGYVLSDSRVLSPHVPFVTRVKAHIEIARLDHSIKNVFVVPGIVVAMTSTHTGFTTELWRTFFVGFLATTLIACSNYVINEVLDAKFDRLHPSKCNRPAARGLVNIPAAYAQWLLMMIAGMALAFTISTPFAITAAALWIMGCFYNIRPFRTKDVVYLDVLTESINNPLRMLLGWYMITSTVVPPTSLLCSYWMLGCFFMGTKRFSEYREIGNAAIAGSYRESFKRYTEQSLLESVTFYAAFAMLMFGAFIMRYRLELILSFPFIALMMATYLHIAFKPGSAAQNPEKLHRDRLLMIELAVTSAVIAFLLLVDIPLISRIFPPSL
jgi:decaprenyl-phosphate phosphoribosyltransferase